MTLPANVDFFEEGPCGLLVTTPDGKIVRANNAFCQWIGYTPDELVDMVRFEALLTRAGKVFLHTHWTPLLQTRRSVAEVKLEICHKDGTRVPTLVTAIRTRYQDADYDKIAVMVVAERYKYELEIVEARLEAEKGLQAQIAAGKALTEAARRKDEFLATLSHELRNPLAPMRNVLELLQKRNFEDADVIWALDVIRRQVGHMTHLVDDLLEVARLTSGKLQLRKEEVDLGAILLDAVEASRPLMTASSHALTVTLPQEHICLEADPTRLSQIAQNLLNNAAKFTARGGQVGISVVRDGHEAVISVRDSGIGIAPENLSRIFEMFAQISPTLEKTIGGLGIGLSMVRAICELHGGTVEARSAGLMQGSEFVIRLPITPRAAHALPPKNATVPRDTTAKRLVVIDDNEDAAVSLAMILELEGHEVRTAFCGIEGIQAAESFDADVMVVDIGLPDITGYEIARRISQDKTRRSRKLIALTGWGQPQDKAEAAAAGFDFHFTKPVDISQILSAISAN